MTNQIEETSWVEHRWLCDRQHKHLSIDKAIACNLRSEEARKKRQGKEQGHPRPGYIDTEAATKKFHKNGMKMSTQMIVGLYTYGFLPGYRIRGQRGRVYIREKELDSFGAFLKTLLAAQDED